MNWDTFPLKAIVQTFFFLKGQGTKLRNDTYVQKSKAILKYLLTFWNAHDIVIFFIQFPISPIYWHIFIFWLNFAISKAALPGCSDAEATEKFCLADGYNPNKLPDKVEDLGCQLSSIRCDSQTSDFPFTDDGHRVGKSAHLGLFYE